MAEEHAKTGKVFDTLVNGDYANPVIVVDEIDKASGNAKLAGRAEISPGDVQEHRNVKRARLGF